MICSKEINALVQLLDDPDKFIHTNVKERLLYLGEGIIPYMETALISSKDLLQKNRISDILNIMRLSNIKQDLLQWAVNNNSDILSAMNILSRYEYHYSELKNTIGKIEKLKRNASLFITEDMSPLEKVDALNHVFFRMHGLKPAKRNYYDVKNSYLNQVLKRKKGNQLSLSIIYLIVAQSLNIPIYGVNMPQHFILAYIDKDAKPVSGIKKYKDILFYIDPYKNGFVLGKSELDLFTKDLNIDSQEDYLLPCSNIDIIKRVIVNLQGSYHRIQDESKASEIQSLHDIINNYSYKNKQ